MNWSVKFHYMHEMKRRNIIVIGGSAGSLSVLKILASQLPIDFPAAVFIVWHLQADSPGVLPEVLARCGSLPAKNATDGERLKMGQIYVAPPDHHMLVDPDQVRVTKGPKENRFRPAVDPLFRSAAVSFGSGVIGVILSGGLDDGTSGLSTVKEYGGTSVVQDPNDAESSSMPESALNNVNVDYCVLGEELGNLLIRLVAEEAMEVPEVSLNNNNHKTEIEIRIAAEENAFEMGINELGEASNFSCPDCHGVMRRLKQGNILRFRCHTGHAYSSETLLATLSESVETSLWSTVRAMEEAVMLLDHMAFHLNDTSVKVAEQYSQKARDVQERTRILRGFVIDVEQLETNELLRQSAKS